MEIDLTKPILLSPDRFTPLTRTPWAGSKIAQLFKSQICSIDTRIGESWEFSCDPSFPSTLMENQSKLIDLVRKYPVEILSSQFSNDMSCQILVKLLNADSPLSLQVHPEDGDPALKENECGKPESWLVLHAEEGAGLYIGFSSEISKEALKDILAQGDKAREILQFVPVEPGDYFEIDPGVPHAIGPGITLLEPQRILFGQMGKTYRLWDWGRKYNAQGIEDAEGEPRQLHLDEGLAIVDSLRQVGMDFVNGLRRRPERSYLGDSTWVSYPENEHYQVHVISGQMSSPLEVSLVHGYAVAVMMEGKVIVGTQDQVEITSGQPALLAHVAFPLCLSGAFELALITPKGASLSVVTLQEKAV